MGGTVIEIIDAHVHCGRQFAEPPQDISDYRGLLSGTGITGAVMIPPVMEIYDRHDPEFEDSPEWQDKRRKSNEYLPTLGDADFKVTPFFFVWNDFVLEQLIPRHKGIKWHRHENEPEYHYDDPLCREAIAEIQRRGLPVLFEESLDNTLRFIRELAPGVKTIIPHLGHMNGGYEVLSKEKIWDLPNLYTDTSPASVEPEIIADYIERYGHERIMFGSDFPFGTPGDALENILGLDLGEEVTATILAGNLKRLLAGR